MVHASHCMNHEFGSRHSIIDTLVYLLHVTMVAKVGVKDGACIALYES